MIVIRIPHEGLLLFAIINVVAVFINPSNSQQIFGHSEKQRYDGWYNNMAHPDWGSVAEKVFQQEIIFGQDTKWI
ncbi:Dual oxidase [Pseudolycoriella hygida]|uniref:Dual oxidase n=1 Tax=Pseudolycoriella hygida TaxID=35572 RepID=A0A9Q0NEE5_9DIPT|nr:Dual oxidase [Pseudolycoriella hygida]